MRSNLADLVREAAGSRADHPAIISDARTLTWADLDAEVDSVAAALLRRGIGPGDRVALLMGNRWELVAAYFGVLRAGCVAVPMNPGLTEHELAYQLPDVQPQLALVTGAAELTVAAAAPDLPRVAVDGTGEDSYRSFALPKGTFDPITTGPDELAVLLFTSGTSGRARAAMLTHRALLSSSASVAAVETPSVRADDVVLLVLPLFHVYALGTLAAVADQGATAVLVERFDPEGTLEVVRRHQVTNIPAAPSMFVAWSHQPGLREAFASVRMLFTGAAPIDPLVLDRIRSEVGLAVFEGYGLTEAAPAVSSTLVGGRAKPGSVGRPFPGVELRLVDEARADVEEGDPGEIWIRGANVFSGYWPDGSDGPDHDGWYATGDVAYLDDDGDLVLVDRRRELVIVNGFNVYPREVEDALAAHPQVAEVAVIGVPDERTGEAVKAYVVPKPGHPLQPEDLQAFAATRLARFKCPSVVTVVDALPHSATGKVAKGRLRELG